ncbi:type II CRISPR-associated endonuclease Cas1 [Candidatus Haliotispira prima]|uniref:CRISPR-associated endonuclease Cas1 n=1 Tax=Candidatus Haliotispira prima TaxID=3034016 RepID=A0ABY8ML33_9SPIO|nr:type II CRISPR-associated endonuclease Cas1 [Candidatus Haliotispira prima]
MMLKRTLYFGNPYHIRLQRKQLLFRAKDGSLEDHCPIEDLGVLVLDHPQISLSMPLLIELAEANVAVVLCDERHLPIAQMLAMRGHSLSQKHHAAQIEASPVLKKQLWKQTVEAKIGNQARLLSYSGRDTGPLPRYKVTVKSGDSDNREAVAAQYYWPSLWGADFVRLQQPEKDKDGPANELWRSVNFLLNYGYSVLRAAVARALVGSGLLLSIGIHHHNQYDPYTLADDVMEPYRPYVDWAVLELNEAGPDGAEIGRTAKQRLLAMLACDVEIGKVKRPLLNALSVTSASLVRCFAGEAKQVEYPRL